jgi:hypothetical protein
MGNPNYRNFGIRDAKFGVPTTTRSNTFTDTGDLVTHASHGLSNGTVVVFQSITTTTGASINVRYYVIGATTNTFQVSTTYGGSAVALTTDGTGTYKAIVPYDIYLANKMTITPKSRSFTYAGDDTEIDRTQILGYTVELDADCIPLATHMALFTLTTQTTALPDSYTALVYGGATSERAGVTAELWVEGTAKRIDETTGLETDVILRRWFPVGTVSGVTPGGQTTGDKAEIEKYSFAASKTAVDAAGGALPATRAAPARAI